MDGRTEVQRELMSRSRSRALGITAPRMLVTGAAGMTGSHVCEVFGDYTLELTDRDSLDVRELSRVRNLCRKFKPNIVLHLAAETDVDLCEQDPKEAFRTNTLGTQNVAIACQEGDSLIVYYSSTNVFSGLPGKVYSEFDTPNPVHIHGLSKWEGEMLIPRFVKRYLIIRAGWMFGGFEKDKKFVGLVRKQIVNFQKKSIRAIEDTKGSPTYALDSLRLTRLLIEKNLLGTFHAVNFGYCTRLQMAQVIAEHYAVTAQSAEQGEFESTVKRPASEMVENWMLGFYGLDKYVRHWRVALKEYLTQWDKHELERG